MPEPTVPTTCPTCNGKGYTTPEILCTTCFGGGAIPILGTVMEMIKAIYQISAQLITLVDACNDIMDKCNDIFEKVNE